jgi:hypothetical protein
MLIIWYLQENLSLRLLNQAQSSQGQPYYVVKIGFQEVKGLLKLLQLSVLIHGNRF